MAAPENSTGTSMAMMAERQNDPTDEGERFSLFEVATFLLRHRGLIASVSGALFAIVVTALLLGDRQYTSSASFMPQSSDRVPGLAGLAAQFGVTTPASDANESPAFYADLVKTREVSTSVLEKDYRFPTDSGVVSAKLVDLLAPKGGSADLRLTNAIDRLIRMLRVDLRTRTGVVALQLRMPNPVLAQQVLQRYLDEVNRFNMERRNSRAGAERRFMERRIVELQRELRDAEDRLQAFLQRNRDYRNSPDLTFQHDRLAQEVEFRRSIYTTIAQSNEKARMDEVRDTPVITVLERPSLPARPDSRGVLKYGFLAIVAGAMVAVGIGFVRDELSRRRAAADPEFAALRLVAHDTRGDLRRILRRVRHPFRRQSSRAP